MHVLWNVLVYPHREGKFDLFQKTNPLKQNSDLGGTDFCHFYFNSVSHKEYELSLDH